MLTWLAIPNESFFEIQSSSFEPYISKNKIFFFFFELIYLCRELVWNITFGQKQPRQDQSLTIRRGATSFWQVGALWELNLMQTISCNQSKILSDFLIKKTDLDIIHDMEIKQNSNFLLKVAKEPQMKKSD